MSNKEERADNESYSKNFTRVPNILFIAYCDLTKEEKYLYSDLRCIYWDMKPRFVSLRELSNQTKYSVSALSKMLPRLHAAGLVHAEIQREKARNGREKGMPKYHITVVDIWEVNRLFFSCSPKEQVELAEVPSAQLVHEIEQACSRNSTRVFTKNDKLVSFGEQDQAQVERAKDNNKDTLKDPFKDEENLRASIDDAILSFSQEKKHLEEQITDLKAQLDQYKQTLSSQATDLGGDTPDTPLTPAGSITVPLGGNTLPTPTDHNTAQSTLISEKQGGTECTVPTTLPTQDKAAESDYDAKASISSVQVHDDSSEQPTEQPQQQASDNSYSPPMTTNNQQVEVPAEKPKRPRRSRAKKPTSFDVSTEMQPRVDKVYEALNKWRLGKTKDPEDVFVPDAESNEAICELLAGKPPTEKRLAKHCDDLWNEPRNKATGYYAREHMTVKTICKTYKAKAMSLADEEKKTSSNSVSGHQNYTFNPPAEKKITPLPSAEPIQLPVRQEPEHPANRQPPRQIRLHRVSEIRDAINARHNAVAQ